MKTIFNKILLFLLAITFSFSCVHEDFLEEEVKSEMTVDNLFNTIEGVEYFMTGIYAMVYIERDRPTAIQDHRETIMNLQMQVGVDNLTTHAHDGPDMLQPLGEWGLVLPSWGQNKDVFLWLYRVINATNTIITRVPEANIEATEKEKMQIVAEAKTIRAWAYRHATYLWGDVPFSKTELVEVQDNFIRESKEVIFDLIEEDLLFAIDNLQEFHPHPGKVNRAVAIHYLAEHYLRVEQWNDAEKTADMLINGGNYQLITDRYGVRKSQPGVPFMDQFLDGNVKRSEGNSEVLWAFIYEPGVLEPDRGSYMNRYHFHRLMEISFMKNGSAEMYGPASLSRFAITPYAFDLYDSSDERGGEYAITHYFDALTDGTDPRTGEAVSIGDRVYTTYYHPDLSEEQKNTPSENDRDFMWPSTLKWVDSDEFYGTTTSGWTFGDQVYLRLAETYLIKAEAQFRQSNNAGAATTINVLRNRANANTVSAADITLDFILDERSRELLGEEHRRYTLVRTNTWTERYRLYNPSFPEQVQDYHALYPIPQDVIDANLDVKMEQNEGYD